MQQETIAGLMRMLEEAKAEAAAVLSPLTRPPSPVKRRALASEAEAAERVRQDRWAGSVGVPWAAAAARPSSCTFCNPPALPSTHLPLLISPLPAGKRSSRSCGTPSWPWLTPLLPTRRRCLSLRHAFASCTLRWRRRGTAGWRLWPQASWLPARPPH